MGSYEITSTVRETCEQGDHIRYVAVSRITPPTEVVDVSVARLMLSFGDIVFLRAPNDNERQAIRKWRCGCGNRTIEIEGS